MDSIASNSAISIFPVQSPDFLSSISQKMVSLMYGGLEKKVGSVFAKAVEDLLAGKTENKDFQIGDKQKFPNTCAYLKKVQEQGSETFQFQSLQGAFYKKWFGFIENFSEDLYEKGEKKIEAE